MMLSNMDKARLEELGQDIERILFGVKPEDIEEAHAIILKESPLLRDIFNTRPDEVHDAGNPIDARA